MKSNFKIKHAVVLINYKNASETVNCINSIKKSKDAPHIIVVDNGSNKKCIAELKSQAPNIDLILSKNLGFSAGNNLGIKKALQLGAEVVYILNNDTEVDPNLFFRSYRYVVGKNLIAGGKIYYAKGYEYHAKQKNKGNIIWYAGGWMDWASVIARHYGVDEIDHGQYEQERVVDFITGCFMAIPRQVINKIGLLDEKFFLYLEDVDYCLRANQVAITLMYNPALIVYHRNSSSAGVGSPLVDYYMTRNRFLIAQRYHSTRLLLALIKEAVFRNWNNPIRRLAFIDFVLRRMGNRNKKL